MGCIIEEKTERGKFHREQKTNGEETSSETIVMSQQFEMKRDISWPLVLFYIHLHILGLYGLWVSLIYATWATIAFTFVLTFLGIIGATAGCHRLWAHRTYTASSLLRIFLMLCQTVAGQGPIYDWVLAHRLHHSKIFQDVDPFFSNRNFLMAQVYGQFLRYSPAQQQLFKTIDMSDIKGDKIVMFQKKLYWLLFFVLHVLLPINTPLAYWGEPLHASILVAFSLRYMIVLNVCWLINSAHFVWGLNKDYRPTDSNTVFFITKSYWPQYHYMLSKDYQSGEFGGYANDFITIMLRVFAALDLASDLYTYSPDAVRKGMAAALESNRSITDCIRECSEEEAMENHSNYSIYREKFM